MPPSAGGGRGAGRCPIVLLARSHSRRGPGLFSRSARRRALLPAQVFRARIWRLAAGGAPNVDIARLFGVGVDVASKWRNHLCEGGRKGLEDRLRSGRHGASVPRWWQGSRRWRASSATFLCRSGARELAALRSLRDSRLDLLFDCAPLAARCRDHGLARSVVDLPRDPHLAIKAARVLDLYVRGLCRRSARP